MIRRLQPKVSDVEGIQLFLQLLQDLTVERSRQPATQFQYSLEDPNAAELATYTRKLVQELSKELHRHRCRQRSTGSGPSEQSSL